MEALATKGKRLIERKPKNVGGDLLLRLFESEWFNSWICLQYLYQHPNSGVEDYLCNKLNELPEPSIEQYLLQYVYLAANRPGSALERTIIGLCSKSFVIAIKVHWLLLALCQDQGKDKHLEAFRDKCERAALDGRWEVPFNDTRVENILSPQQSSLSPVTSGLCPSFSPIVKPPTHPVMGSSPPHDSAPDSIMLATPGILNKIDEGVELLPNGHSPCMSMALPPASGAGVKGEGCNDQEDDLDGFSDSLKLRKRMNLIRAELGEGEGVTTLLDCSSRGKGLISVTENELVLSDDDNGGMGNGCPLSPTTKVRHDAYGATLDFLEALCDTSFALVSVPLQEERQRALRHGLEAINRDLNKQARQNVAVWFPLGSCNERVLRIVSKEAVLLNSREKAPFMLFIEVLETGDPANTGHSLAPQKPFPLTPTRGSIDYDTFMQGQPQQDLVASGLLNASMGGQTNKSADSMLSKDAQATVLPTLPQQEELAPPCHSSGVQGSTGSETGMGVDLHTPVKVNHAGVPPEGHAPVQEPHGGGLQGNSVAHTQGPGSHGVVDGRSYASVAAAQQQQSDAAQQPVPSLGRTSLVIPQRRRQASKQTDDEASTSEAFHRTSTSSATSSNQTDQPHQQQHTLVASSSIGSSIAAAVPHHGSTLGMSLHPQQGAGVEGNLTEGHMPVGNSPGVSQNDNSLLSSGVGITSAAAVAASGILSPPHLQQQQQQRDTSSTLSSVVRSLCFAEPSADLPSLSDPSKPPFHVPPLSLPPTFAQSHNQAAHHLSRFGWFDSNSNTQPNAPASLEGGSGSLLGPFSNSGTLNKTQPPLTEDELQELMAAGCLSPSACEGPREKEFMSRMASVMASLRGDAPLVRLHLKVLDPPPQMNQPPPHPSASPQCSLSPTATESTPPKSSSRHAGTPPRSGRFSGELCARFASESRGEGKEKVDTPGVDGSSKGSEDSGSRKGDKEKGTPKISIGPISIGRLKSSPGASAVIAEHEAAAGDLSDSERHEVSSNPPGMLAQKSLTLLSRLGLCRRPIFGSINCDSDEGEDSMKDLCNPNAHPRSIQGRPNSSRNASGIQIAQRDKRLKQQLDRLVAVSLQIAGGMDLTIPSPYRKSRRTPSSEAISLVASKLKISSMPPPHQSGPPLNPPHSTDYVTGAGGDSASEGPWGSEVSTSVSELGRGWSDGKDGNRGRVVSSPGHVSHPAQHVPFLPLPPSPPSRSENFLTTAANFGSSLLSSAAAIAAAALGAGTAASSSAPPAPAANQEPQSLVPASSLSFQSGIGGGGSYWQHPPASSNKHTLHHKNCPSFPPHDFGGIVSAAAAAQSRSISPLRSPRRSISGKAHLPPHQQRACSEQYPVQGPNQPAQTAILPSSAFNLQSMLPKEVRTSMPPDLLQGECHDETTQGFNSNSTTDPHSNINNRSSKDRGEGSGSCRAAMAVTVAAAAEAADLSHVQQRSSSSGWADSRESMAGRRGPTSQGGQAVAGESNHKGGQGDSVFAARGVGPSVGNSPAASPAGPGRVIVGGTAGSSSTPPLSGQAYGGGVRYMAPPCSIRLGPAAEAARQEAWAVYGERWADKVERIKRESPHGQQKGWALRGVIVKSGDDCRQELLAVQLVHAFAEIFQDAGLPLRLRYYDVLVTSNRTALIEVVPDALSVHTVKHRSPYGASLSDHFFAKWPKGTPECVAAQRRLTESLAAYSIICYLLQIKDRHNGNILLDDQGCLVHIDFGFMLSNSPGGVNFEAAPFKLTREMLEVMDSNSEGKPSEMFDYFKVLVIQGFLACRKHHDRLLLMVRMMSRSGFPCFKQGDRSVKALEKRFQLQLTEVQCVQSVLGLISDSLDAWRTRQYDYYQRLLNGIL